jgi:hypothetical protein
MTHRNTIFQAELIEETVLPTNGRAHHHRDPSLTSSAPRNHTPPSCSKDFFNTLSQKEKSVLPKEVEHWPLTALREKLVKIGAKVVRHGRYWWPRHA